MTTANRPARSALRYRLGTHPTFLRRMLEQLDKEEIPDGEHRGARPLGALTTQDPGDPAIALLDASACVADVLTFYQERIANEGYLRTATERGSVLELARAIGYERSPGVAASAWLAFQVEEASGSASILSGTQAQSIPSEGEQPQTFETSDLLTAQASWNAFRPVTQVPKRQVIEAGREIRLQGTNTQLRTGDKLLIVGRERENTIRCFLTVQSVTPSDEQGITLVAWTRTAGADSLPENPRVFAFRYRGSLFGHDAPDWKSLPDLLEIEPKLPANTKIRFPLSKQSFLGGTGSGPFPDEWPGFECQPTEIDLDRVNSRISAGSLVVLESEVNDEAHAQFIVAKRVTTVSRNHFTLRAKVTRVFTEVEIDPEQLDLRGTVVHGESEELTLSKVSTPLVVGGDRLVVERIDPLPKPRQALVFVADGATAQAEIAFVRRVEDVPGRPEQMCLLLQAQLEHTYEPENLVIHGNVVRATHGETVREVLGSGDATQAHQRFTLRVPPLTYAPDPDTGAVASTLSVWIDGVRWREAPALLDLDDRSQSYVVRIADDGTATLTFGDGVRGARIPSGQENVVAAYRSGGGLQGNVQAGCIALLKNRPLGVRSVTNPLPATGGAPLDDLGEARANAPRSVLTMDRLVSLADYENFAGAFAGIAKASAVLLRGGEGRLLHLTVAGLGGREVSKDSGLHRSLREAVAQAGDLAQGLRMDSYRPREFRLRARLRMDPRYRADDVLDEARTVLTDSFSFERRSFGQSVAASEVIALVQGVAGVVAVDLDALYEANVEPALHSLVKAQLARYGTERVEPAELLTLTLAQDDVTEETSRE